MSVVEKLEVASQVKGGRATDVACMVWGKTAAKQAKYKYNCLCSIAEFAYARSVIMRLSARAVALYARQAYGKLLVVHVGTACKLLLTAIGDCWRHYDRHICT